MSSILQKQVATTAGAITLVTTAETLLIYSGRVEATYPTLRYIIKGWVNLTTGTGVTGLILKIRRGNGITGTQVGSVQIALAASVLEEMHIWFSEQLLNVEFADYSLTATQVAATGNGTSNVAQIEVETING